MLYLGSRMLVYVVIRSVQFDEQIADESTSVTYSAADVQMT